MPVISFWRCVFFVGVGRGPTTAHAEDGELGPQALPQSAVWRVYWPSGETRQEEGSPGGNRVTFRCPPLSFLHSAFCKYELVVFCRPVWKGYDWTCRSHMKITQVRNKKALTPQLGVNIKVGCRTLVRLLEHRGSTPDASHSRPKRPRSESFSAV